MFNASISNSAARCTIHLQRCLAHLPRVCRPCLPWQFEAMRSSLIVTLGVPVLPATVPHTSVRESLSRVRSVVTPPLGVLFPRELCPTTSRGVHFPCGAVPHTAVPRSPFPALGPALSIYMALHVNHLRNYPKSIRPPVKLSSGTERA